MTLLDALELLYLGLLILAGLAIAGVSAITIYALFKGQR